MKQVMNVLCRNVLPMSKLLIMMALLMYSSSYIGMAGKDELSNAILGGASDYLSDIRGKIMQWYQAKDEDKVLCLYINIYKHTFLSCMYTCVCMCYAYYFVGVA